MSFAIWISIGVGALVYWLTRYDRLFGPSIHHMTRFEYMKCEWPALIYGGVGGVILSGVYVYAGEAVWTVIGRLWDYLAGIPLPGFNFVFALLFGFAGYDFSKRVPRIINWFGTRIKLPGA